VSEDWRAWLPEAHDQVFRWTVGELDAGYTMLSVTLDEAIAVRCEGDLRKARLEAGFCAQLVDRFSATLATTLRTLEEHVRYYGTIPNTAPLDPANFRFPRSQRLARMHLLLCRVLFSARSLCLHKLHALRELVDELAPAFRETALELADGTSITPGELWEALDSLHYDLNTCLRETLVLLKSFLRALPEDELDTFRKALGTPARPSTSDQRVPRRAPRLVRAASAGQR
jgi:hypothetical protein